MQSGSDIACSVPKNQHVLRSARCGSGSVRRRGGFGAPSSDASGTATSATQNVLILRNGTSYVATALHMDGNRLSYTLGDGTFGTVSLDDVDWTKTFQNNAENGAVLAVVSESARR